MQNTSPYAVTRRQSFSLAHKFSICGAVGMAFIVVEGLLATSGAGDAGRHAAHDQTVAGPSSIVTAVGNPRVSLR